MPRKARILVPYCPHHLVQRGHDRKAVFVSNNDYQYYLGNLIEWKTKLGLRLYAWCLMTNHIHLIVEPHDDVTAISQLMKRINGRQTAYVNRLEGRSGALWEGRYKASPIQTDMYLLSCLRYVELNPVSAGMVAEPETYPWSSYRYRNAEPFPEILDLDTCYLSLGSDNRERFAKYRDFVSQGISQQERDFLRASYQRNQLSGNGRFVDEIERRIGIRVERRSRGRPSLE